VAFRRRPPASGGGAREGAYRRVHGPSASLGARLSGGVLPLVAPCCPPADFRRSPPDPNSTGCQLKAAICSGFVMPGEGLEPSRPQRGHLILSCPHRPRWVSVGLGKRRVSGRFEPPSDRLISGRSRWVSVGLVASLLPSVRPRAGQMLSGLAGLRPAHCCESGRRGVAHCSTPTSDPAYLLDHRLPRHSHRRRALTASRSCRQSHHRARRLTVADRGGVGSPWLVISVIAVASFWSGV
jgi:hypothetical protein